MKNTELVYNRLWLVSQKHHCPVCQQNLQLGELCKVRLYNYRMKSTQIRRFPLLYCNTCAICCVDGKQLSKINSTVTSYSAVIMKKENPITLKRLVEKICADYEFHPIAGIKFLKQHPREAINSSFMKKKYTLNTLPIAAVNRNAATKKISCTILPLKNCPYCKASLRTATNHIPISETECAILYGDRCNSCNIFYFRDLDQLQSITDDNSCIGEYSFSFDFYSNDYTAGAHALHSNPDCFMIFVLRETQKNKIKTVVLSHNHIESNLCQILKYTELLARELLTVCFAEESTKTEIEIENEFYEILYTETKANSSLAPVNFLIDNIYLKAGGGLYASQKKNDNEIVTVFLFSPYTQRYELATASYDKKSNMYYMDGANYRRFIMKYGRPKIRVSVGLAEEKNSDSVLLLKERSLLHEYGYHVSQGDCLPAHERTKILGEVIDLELMSPVAITQLLERMIRLHTNEKFENACSKWKEDIEFVSNYRINTSRFIISKQVRKL